MTKKRSIGYHHSQEKVHCAVCGKWGTHLKDVGKNLCEDHEYMKGRR